MTMGYRTPNFDLCAFLRNDPDLELADHENVGSASNRHIRLLHVMWMLDCGLAEAIALYEGSGQRALLDREGRLETPGVVAEVIQLIQLSNASIGNRSP